MRRHLIQSSTHSLRQAITDIWAASSDPDQWLLLAVLGLYEDRPLASARGRALVLKVDTEALPALSQRYNVQGIPNFIVFKEGHVAFQQAGLVRADSMVSWLT